MAKGEELGRRGQRRVLGGVGRVEWEREKSGSGREESTERGEESEEKNWSKGGK